jgi:hypothetical protein
MHSQLIDHVLDAMDGPDGIQERRVLVRKYVSR